MEGGPRYKFGMISKMMLMLIIVYLTSLMSQCTPYMYPVMMAYFARSCELCSSSILYFETKNSDNFGGIDKHTYNSL